MNREHVSTLLEAAGAIAVTCGVGLWAGVAAALMVGGVLAVVFGYAVGVDR